MSTQPMTTTRMKRFGLAGLLAACLFAAVPALAQDASDQASQGDGTTSQSDGAASTDSVDGAGEAASAVINACPSCEPDPGEEVPPTISLTSPTNGQGFSTGDTVTLSATASDSDGTVIKVLFFVDGTSVGTDFTSPYSMSWTATAGSHAVYARADDNSALSTSSGTATITVTTPGSGGGAGSETPTPTPLPAAPGTFSRTETITYHDNASKWVLGQVATVTCLVSVPSSSSCDGDVMSKTTYDGTYALPLKTYAFGKLRQTAGYNTTATVASGQRGTLKTIKDGNNHTTTFTSWNRGIPQSIAYADSTSQSAVVDALGQITSVTDENGYQTHYGYDAMGRLNKIVYPTGDSTAWSDTNRTFVQVASTEYGIAANHWRETVTTGNAVRITYYDAKWQPLLVREYDSANQSGTQRFTRLAYDGEGRATFQSYPSTSSSPATGVWTDYDALGRATSVSQDSELGLLTTFTEYLSGYRTRVTNPRGFQTISTYLAYDQPGTDWPLVINAPDGAITTIARDPHGKPLSLARSGGGVTPVVRSYAYDSYQRLCRSVEPETGATLYGYDNAGNLAWSAAGLASGQACSTTGGESAIVARKASRSYDARNRLATLTFPDGNGNQTWTYTADGLPDTVATSNGGNVVSNGYSYNRRRLLTGESVTPDTALAARAIGYGYNALGQVISESTPDNVLVSYTRNALGQATQVTTRLDGGTVRNTVTGASYYPNGAVRQFTYGNGIVHTMTQNARQLPGRSADGTVLDLTTVFDENGNVLAVTDAIGTGRQGRSLGYDGLDRLTDAQSPMFGTARYAYDTLDNLTHVQVSGGTQARNHTYCYNSKNQLDFVRTGSDCSSSPAAIALTYDVQGNVLGKNSAVYAFDYGNRLRTGGGQSYRYDADGRRVRSDAAGAGLRYSQYAKDGRLLWQRDEVAGKRISNVYFAGSLVAEYSRPLASNTVTASYYHTDALGSPVAKTNSSGAVTQTSEYEPYGDLLNRGNDDRVGYTGHVMDGATGLTYMQQRYYDPQIGRFLSVDPVTVDTASAKNLNRYAYAFGNTYRFIDPDGRQARTSGDSAECGDKKCIPDIPPPPPGCGSKRECYYDGQNWHTSPAPDAFRAMYEQALTAGRAWLASSSTAASAYGVGMHQKIGGYAFSYEGIILKWSGGTKSEVQAAKNLSKVGNALAYGGVALAIFDFGSAASSNDNFGMIKASADGVFSGIGVTPWGLPASVAYGATSAVMDTPLGKQFSSKLADMACSATGNC